MVVMNEQTVFITFIHCLVAENTHFKLIVKQVKDVEMRSVCAYPTHLSSYETQKFILKCINNKPKLFHMC